MGRHSFHTMLCHTFWATYCHIFLIMWHYTFPRHVTSHFSHHVSSQFDSVRCHTLIHILSYFCHTFVILLSYFCHTLIHILSHLWRHTFISCHLWMIPKWDFGCKGWQTQTGQNLIKLFSPSMKRRMNKLECLSLTGFSAQPNPNPKGQKPYSHPFIFYLTYEWVQ
jgi:hypothetical protein